MHRYFGQEMYTRPPSETLIVKELHKINLVSLQGFAVHFACVLEAIECYLSESDYFFLKLIKGTRAPVSFLARARVFHTCGNGRHC